jgi:hypothetical protein
MSVSGAAAPLLVAKDAVSDTGRYCDRQERALALGSSRVNLEVVGNLAVFLTENPSGTRVPESLVCGSAMGYACV